MNQSPAKKYTVGRFGERRCVGKVSDGNIQVNEQISNPGPCVVSVTDPHACKHGCGLMEARLK